MKAFSRHRTNHFVKGLISMAFLQLVMVITINAQPADSRVSARIDTSQIRIGEQFRMTLSAKLEEGANIRFPLLADTFSNFEVVKKGTIDTVVAENQERNLRQELTLTSFDSGYHVIPPMPFVYVNGGTEDTALSEAMLMTVTTVAVDTTKEIKAIKDIVAVPFPWQDYILYIIIGVVLIAIGIYLLRRYNTSKPLIPKYVAPKRPAHEIALENLRRIEEEKLWQQGLVKKYYSEVTDTLRTYIEGRFSVPAMEQTTPEIIDQLGRSVTKPEETELLESMLRLADMVKFAKAIPLPPENEKIMQQALSFVNTTRPATKLDVEIAEDKQ